MARPDKPAGISLNLDTLEAEGAVEPFVVVIGGKPITFADAEDIDYRELMDLYRDPSRFFEVTVTDAKSRTHIDKTTISLRKLRVLLDEYMKHYGMDVTQGESGASS